MAMLNNQRVIHGFPLDPNSWCLGSEVKTFLAEKGFGFIESAVASEGQGPFTIPNDISLLPSGYLT
jgi:hypothetical protein